MPIKPENRHFYEGDWPEIRRRILERAKNRCEQCGAPNGVNVFYAWARRWIRVVLTIAHLDQNPANNDDSNLKALCQRCHLNHDRPYNLSKSRLTRSDKKDALRPILSLLSEDCSTLPSNVE